MKVLAVTLGYFVKLLLVTGQIQIFSVMEDDKSLSDYGLTSTVAKAQQPAEVALADGKDGDADDN